MNFAIWIVISIVGVYLQRQVSTWAAAIFPGSSPVDDISPDHAAAVSRDLGFSLFPVTPPSLPDIWFLTALILTIVAVSNRNRSPRSPDIKMLNHLMYAGGIIWVFCSQLSFLSTIPLPDSDCLTSSHPPLHSFSLFARSSSLRLSFHATVITILMLSWQTYHPIMKIESMRRAMMTSWILSLVSIMSSRIDYTADVVRGTIFSYIIFYSFIYFSVDNMERQDATRNEINISVEEKPRKPSRGEGVVDAKRSQPEVKVVQPAKPAPFSAFVINAEVTRLRDVYLTLLRHALTNTLYEDSPLVVFDCTDRSNFIRNSAYNWRIREAGLDLPQKAHSRSGGMRLQTLGRCVEQLLAETVRGDLLDIGVWRGGDAAYMRGVLLAFNCNDRNVIMADNFKGAVFVPNRLKFFLKTLCAVIPMTWVVNILSLLTRIIPKAANFPMAAEHRRSDSSSIAWLQFRLSNPGVVELSSERTDLASVKDMLKRYELLDGQVHFLIGDVKHTLSSVDTEEISLFRVGGRISEPDTLQALICLYPRLSVGGYVFIDDYSGTISAINRFREERDIHDPIIWVDHQCVFWRKAA
uniref:Macrocin O-methyltransferase n=2 Tax=Spongospora subterranea TaxID=70186 RepID=A0A0H5RK05_9EUKA|eukprot:CRZ09054.1 hypothetical protein [Spongospora subterranea]